MGNSENETNANHSPSTDEEAVDQQSASAAEAIREKERLAFDYKEIDKQKIDLERRKLEKDLQWYWRVFQALGLVGPALAFLIGIFSIARIYQETQDQYVHTLLRDVGAAEPAARLSAISALSVYRKNRSSFGRFGDWFFGATELDLPRTIASVLRLEKDTLVKKEMLRAMTHLDSDSTEQYLALLRGDLISKLKNEDKTEMDDYWKNLRETLFLVAVAISRLSSSPPDFRCFPLKKYRIRQLIIPDGANFQGATLAFAELWGSKLRGAKFQDANLYKAVIRDVDLTGASFEGANLRDATFGPNIRGLDPAVFRNTNWQSAKFEPDDIRQQLETRLGPSSGKERHGRNLDDLCTDVLTQEFQLRP